jgi:hypothetical protein
MFLSAVGDSGFAYTSAFDDSSKLNFLDMESR